MSRTARDAGTLADRTGRGCTVLSLLIFAVVAMLPAGYAGATVALAVFNRIPGMGSLPGIVHRGVGLLGGLATVAGLALVCATAGGVAGQVIGGLVDRLRGGGPPPPPA